MVLFTVRDGTFQLSQCRGPMLRRLLTLSFLLSACATVRPAAAPLRIDTTDGPIRGRQTDGVRAFLGLPFAAPPLGPLRWKPPAPPTPWTVERDVTRFGPACPQLDSGFPRELSEDCLTLNIWVPEGSSVPRPVFVWIHGGAFVGGSGSDDLYDGAKLAAHQGLVVVTINYRLGPLGFLSHPAVAKELGRDAAPSVGLLDQRAALAWLQRNIARFGGDPARVTIGGASAGAWSVCSHLGAPGSRDLFAGAVMQSGACSDALYASAESAAQQAEDLTRAVGCAGDDALACLRRQPVETLLRALPAKRGQILKPGVWWSPVIDGVELPRMPLASLRSGDFARVPLLIGWNRDEGVIHTIGFKESFDEDVKGFTRDSFPRAAEHVVERYRRATPKDALNDVVTDAVFACGARRAVRAVSGHGVPVYAYQWMHPLDDERVHPLGATHGVEVFFVFGNMSLGFGPSPAERPLVDTVMAAWGSFVRGQAPWKAEPDTLFLLDLPARSPATQVKKAECDWWDSFQP